MEDIGIITGDYSPWIEAPWGKHRTLFTGPHAVNKILHVNPGHRTSLQYHHKRAEFWYVIAGHAEVEIYNQNFYHRIDLNPEEYVYIPKSAPHRLKNPHHGPLIIYETWLGDDLSESDISRLADDYGRGP